MQSGPFVQGPREPSHSKATTERASARRQRLSTTEFLPFAKLTKRHMAKMVGRAGSPTAYERKPKSLPTTFAFLMSAWLSFFGTPSAWIQMNAQWEGKHQK